MLISNFGNLTGKEFENECKPLYINKAINNGFYVKINVFYINSRIFVGNNEPLYLIDIEYNYELDPNR